VATFGVRDCSVQRRNQKIIEETPPPHFSEDKIEEIEQAAARLLKRVDYESAATVEFLYDMDRDQFYFMEVNTRLQVEHPITEELFGIDLVQGQLRIAMGLPLYEEGNNGGTRTSSGLHPSAGSVVEVRLNAEDPDLEFSPAPGKVTLFKQPGGPGIRVDAGVWQGSTVPNEFDSMIGKIIARGRDRNEAVARLKRALTELHIRIEGGTTNRAFLKQLLSTPQIKEGGVHTRFVEEFIQNREEVIERPRWDAALLAAAVEKYTIHSYEELVNFKQQLSANGQPREVGTTEGIEVNLKAQHTAYSFIVKAMGNNHYHIEYENCVIPVRYFKRESNSLMMYRDTRYWVQTVHRGDNLQCEIDGVPYLIEIESSGIVRASSPSMVLSIHVRPGQEVNKGDVLVSLEAMKMEILLSAPEPGLVRDILVKPGEQVAAGEPLLSVDVKTEDEASDEREAIVSQQVRQPVTFIDAEDDSEKQWDMLEREYRAVFLGYDHTFEVSALLRRMMDFAKQNSEFTQHVTETLFSGVQMFAEIEPLFVTGNIASAGAARTASSQELLSHYFRRDIDREKGIPEQFLELLRNALFWYPESSGPQPDDERFALLRMYKSHVQMKQKQELLQQTLFAFEELEVPRAIHTRLSNALDQVIYLTQKQTPSLADAAYHTRYTIIDKAYLGSIQAEKRAKIGRLLSLIIKHERKNGTAGRYMRNIIDTGHHIVAELVDYACSATGELQTLAWEVLARRFNRDREYEKGQFVGTGDHPIYKAESRNRGTRFLTFLMLPCREDDGEKSISILEQAVESAAQDTAGREEEKTSVEKTSVEIILLKVTDQDPAAAGMVLCEKLSNRTIPCSWVSVGVFDREGRQSFRTLFPETSSGELQEDLSLTCMNPLQQRELRVGRLRNFERNQLYASDSVWLVRITDPKNERDERFIAFVDVPTARMEMDGNKQIRRIIALEQVFMEAVYTMRAEQAKRKRRLYWNRIIIHIRGVLNTTLHQIGDYAGKLAIRSEDLGIEKLIVYTRRPTPDGSGIEEIELDFDNISGTSFTLQSRGPSEEPLKPMDRYVAKVVRARQRGTLYPYELIKMVTRTGYPLKEPFPKGEFEEFDIEIDETTGEQRTLSVKEREYGENTSNIVFGIITNYLTTHPKGVKRVLLLTDPTRDMGALAESECRRVIAALDMAEERGIPVEWLPISAGARIDMDSGTENLDWTARTLRRIVEFTQRGGEINIVVAGINVGAQSYWNAESTMLMHNRGLLIMTDDAAMLLTGKKALDYSGSVSAEDNIGIGGLKRIMGPNGQAQLPAKTLHEAYTLLFRHYALTYASGGARFPERLSTNDTTDRNIGNTRYNDLYNQGFSTIGDIFSKKSNPERKKPFDMRQVMAALVDSDCELVERWKVLQDGETGIVWEARIGGFGAGLLGIESRPLTRIGEVPYDGPESYSGGTLYPIASKKIARGINAFSGKLPLVILANLSGFDGSPESLRKLQLEYGAEIGRAIVNFSGPIIFIVTARYHGGAYVVFSKALNENLHAVAIEGSFASVIGGGPAAAVVFPRMVEKETYRDPRIVKAREQVTGENGMTGQQYDELFYEVFTEKQSELAARFDAVHSVERAKQVGSIDKIVTINALREYVIEKIEKGIKNVKK